MKASNSHSKYKISRGETQVTDVMAVDLRPRRLGKQRKKTRMMIIPTPDHLVHCTYVGLLFLSPKTAFMRHRLFFLLLKRVRKCRHCSSSDGSSNNPITHKRLLSDSDIARLLCLIVVAGCQISLPATCFTTDYFITRACVWLSRVCFGRGFDRGKFKLTMLFS